MDETLCDVVLVPGDSDETFHVHRVIMASSSDYFKAMFTGESSRWMEVTQCHNNHSNYPKHGAEAVFDLVLGNKIVCCLIQWYRWYLHTKYYTFRVSLFQLQQIFAFDFVLGRKPELPHLYLADWALWA